MFGRAAASSSPAASSAWTVQSISSTRNGNHNSKRRFDDTQIRSLETIFQTEARPELRVKQQLANKLGLQPRQVAIWFQNKRARSKSKQIEHEYNILKGSYDNLASKYESLKKENESLLTQLQNLRKLTAKMGSEEYEKEHKKMGIHDKPDLPLETYDTQLYMSTCQDRNDALDYPGHESNALAAAQIADASLTSPENGCSFESNDLIDNSSCNSQWWEF